MNAISFREDVLPLKDKIFRLALRITLDRQEAEDIVQDILMRIWDRRESLGEVESIAAGTGSAFSPIPVDNATGNFVKVEQRVPVRIKVTTDNADDVARLLAGLNVETEVMY